MNNNTVYVVGIGQGDFLCSGSYVFQGERYQIVGNFREARRFKNKQSAQNWINKLFGTRANVRSENYDIIQIIVNEKGKNEEVFKEYK